MSIETLHEIEQQVRQQQLLEVRIVQSGSFREACQLVESLGMLLDDLTGKSWRMKDHFSDNLSMFATSSTRDAYHGAAGIYYGLMMLEEGLCNLLTEKPALLGNPSRLTDGLVQYLEQFRFSNFIHEEYGQYSLDKLIYIKEQVAELVATGQPEKISSGYICGI